MTHAERYSYLVDKQRGGKVDNSYRAAFYLLSCEEELFEKSKEFAVDGIDCSFIKKRLNHTQNHLYPLVDVAENLYRWESDCKMTPHMIAILSPTYLGFIITAIHIAGGKCTVKVADDELCLDFSSMKEEVATGYLDTQKDCMKD